MERDDLKNNTSGLHQRLSQFFARYFGKQTKEVLQQPTREEMRQSLFQAGYFGGEQVSGGETYDAYRVFVGTVTGMPLTDDGLVSQLYQKQMLLTGKECHTDHLSFVHEEGVQCAIEDVQNLLGQKRQIVLVDAFCGTHSLQGIIGPWHDAFDLKGYLGIDIVNTPKSPVGYQALSTAFAQGIPVGFLQSDAYSGLSLLPECSVDILLLNGIDYTITSEEYMHGVLEQALRILTDDGVISCLCASFFPLTKPLRDQLEMVRHGGHLCIFRTGSFPSFGKIDTSKNI